MLTKEESKALRGVSILFIALHNFVHLLGYAKENEKFFHIERWNDFFNLLIHPSSDIILNIFSFIGWVGVPVFIFLSGYGLVMKYEIGSGQLITRRFLGTNFKKLFWLMLPGVCFFILWDFFQGDFIIGIKKLLYLTLANNLFYPFNKFAPGVYWYFGFTFQLYIIYLFFYRYRNKKTLVSSFILFFAITLVIPNSVYGQVALSYLKNNSIGWLPIFLLGICAGRYWDKKMMVFPKWLKSKWFMLICSLLCFIAVILMNGNYYSWQLMPFIALFMFVSFVKGVSTERVIGKCMSWLGEHSSSIFVVHPIARLLTMQISSSTNVQNIYILIGIYLPMTLFIAFYYTKLYNTLRLKFIK